MPTSSYTLVGLPDDILCELYAVLADIDPPHLVVQYVHTDASLNPLGWICLTHACRRLRALGLSLATLWGRIVCVFPKGCKEILERSKDAPLVLNLRPLSYTSSIDFFDYLPIFDLLHRACSITDQVSNMHIAPRKHWWLSSPLDNLRYLNLNAISSPLWGDDWGSIVAPALRSYSLGHAYFPCTAPLLRSLTITHAGLPWMELLECLRSYPLLTNLRITEMSTIAAWSPQPGVSLPYLEHFYANLHSCENAIQLLDHLQFSQSANCDIAVWEEASDFVHLVLSRPHFDSPMGDTLSISTWYGEDAGGLRISLADTFERPCAKYGAIPYERLQLQTALDRDNEFQLADAFWNIPLATLRSVRILAMHSGRSLDDVFWRYEGDLYDPLPVSNAAFASVWRAACRLQGLETIYFCDVGRQSMDLLMPHPEWESSMALDSVAFPTLRTIVIDSKYCRVPREVWDDLLGVVEARRAAGRPIEQVVLMGDSLYNACTAGVESIGRDIGADDDRDQGESASATLPLHDTLLELLRSLVEVIDLRTE